MEAIAFSGGKESMKLVKLLKSKKPRPILVTYLPEGDTAGLVPLYEYFAKKEGFKILFHFGKADGLDEVWTYTTDGVVTDYTNELMEFCRKNKIHVLYLGRKESDFHGKRTIIEIKRLKYPKNLKVNPRVVFPLWEK